MQKKKPVKKKSFPFKINTKEIMKKLKNIIKRIKRTKTFKYINKNKEMITNVILFSLPFIILNIVTRLFFLKKMKDIFYLPGVLFNLLWTLLFVGVSFNLKDKIGKIVYWVFLGLGMLMFLTNGIYFSLTKAFFDFSLVEMASEGSEYIVDTIKNANVLVYLSFIGVLIYSIYIFRKRYPKVETNNLKRIGIYLVIFTLVHVTIPVLYGRANTELTWDTWRNKRNIYNNFNDDIQGMKITDLYEYTFRNFYITFLKRKQTIDEKEIAFLEGVYQEENNKKHSNEYTNMFKGKNLIFLQLEGMDKWIVNEENTPNLYKLMNSSINFNNHYSFYNGGGSTFNSEFAINTGFITPFSYTRNAYTFNKNNFPYTMAKLFKNEGYAVNAYHMNSADYYSRGINYQNWGYDSYNGLKDLGTYTDNDHYLDTELINNEVFYESIFNKENKFVDYIITYSVHTPFTNTKGVCKKVIEKDSLDIKKNNIATTDDEIILSEEDCVKIQAKETDDMVGLLIQGLKDNGLYDNTVIVAYADHYLYTLTDQTILDKYKETSNNLINNTPLFIWSSNVKKLAVNKVTSQLNVLPTVLNLFGIDHNDNYYIGEDALDKSYEGIVFFPDYSWYNGSYYITSDTPIDEENTKLNELNSYVYYLTKKNDLTLKYDYFKKIKSAN